MPFVKQERKHSTSMWLLVKRLVNQPRMFLACLIVGGFHPFEKNWSTWESFQSWGENNPTPLPKKQTSFQSIIAKKRLILSQFGLWGRIGWGGTSGRITTFHLSTCCAFETGIYQALQGRNLRTWRHFQRLLEKPPHAQWPHLLSRKYILCKINSFILNVYIHIYIYI